MRVCCVLAATRGAARRDWEATSVSCTAEVNHSLLVSRWSFEVCLPCSSECGLIRFSHIGIGERVFDHDERFSERYAGRFAEHRCTFELAYS